MNWLAEAGLPKLENTCNTKMAKGVHKPFATQRRVTILLRLTWTEYERLRKLAKGNMSSYIRSKLFVNEASENERLGQGKA